LEKTEGKRSLGKPRQRREKNNEFQLKEIGRRVDWNVSAQDGDRAECCERRDEASGSIKWSYICHSLS
jgi:hypothetical protein